MRLAAAAIVLALLAAAQPQARAAPIPVVAAENFYGDVASELGGRWVTVLSVLASPDVDPHLFEVNPSVGRAVARARIVIMNGLGYDPWMQHLLEATTRPGRTTITVGRLIGGKPGDNPHIWYDPRTMLALAAALEPVLAAADPEHAPEFAARLTRFRAGIGEVEAQIARLRARLQGTAVTATEPVFGYMFRALGMNVRNREFQVAVMNNTEPSAIEIARFETDLRERRVALLVYNRQVNAPIAARMRRIAKRAGIPVLGVTETEPAGVTYQTWIERELEALARLLPGKQP
ncbi:MAG: metal ABC transporter solute-binding protein, Zn/Mn family [Acetobacteraceae bacterium]